MLVKIFLFIFTYFLCLVSYLLISQIIVEYFEYQYKVFYEPYGFNNYLKLYVNKFYILYN